MPQAGWLSKSRLFLVVLQREARMSDISRLGLIRTYFFMREKGGGGRERFLLIKAL